MFLEEVSTPQPVFISDVSILLDVCGWKVPAGFSSSAADHAQERIDLNKQLIRKKEATDNFRAKGDSITGCPTKSADTRLMNALDGVNQRFGRGTVKVSTPRAHKCWQTLQERRSPNYTTAWDAVPVV
jgi:Domain of unknown function (DUF4113)